MATEKQIRQEAQDEKDRIKAGKAYDKEMPEPDTTFGKLGRKAAGAAAAVPSGLMGGVLMGLHPEGPNVVDAAKYGAKLAYHTATGDKKAADEATKEVEAATKRAQSVKTKRNTGETTNAAGDSYKKGGSVSSASSRADGCATKGKTRGKFV